MFRFTIRDVLWLTDSRGSALAFAGHSYIGPLELESA